MAMRTRAMAFILALTLVMSLVGCGKKASDPVGPSAELATQATMENASASESASIINSTSNNEVETTVDESTASNEMVTTEAETVIESSEIEMLSTEETLDPEEEARLKAEEEARLKAEEEARLKAEEEARLKAEEEAKKKAEEERLKAEAEKRKKTEEAKKKAEEERIRKEQLNSFSMMYYLAITAEEIRTSRNNRLLLDDIYTSLLNDINPGAVDEITQDHLRNLRDIIKAYRNISVKRDRLQYIYNQDKAAAMRSAVPNPIAILSMANSLDWKRLAMSAVYAAVDSYNRYKTASENADKAFLMSGWELDDEEVATVQKNRDRAFDYMVAMVQKYQLDGMKTLNEKAIEKFAEICAIESIPERISRLRSEEKTYSLLGNYWLELADCYFQTDRYDKCLECVEKYNKLATGIFRKDNNYVQILPKAIVAAQNTYTGTKYITTTKEFADAIIKNTSTEDWSIRYFVAQVYMDLYTRTKAQPYLRSAYNIAYDNVTILLKGQRELNSIYIADVQEVKVEEPDYRYLTEKEKKEKQQEYNEEKKRANTYNKAIKDARVTELPSLYEPLVLNCELLFALADKMNIKDSEKKEIDAILQTDTNGTFITQPINNAFSFFTPTKKYSLVFSKEDIAIPVVLLTAGTKVTVSVTENGNTQTFDDCVIQKVVRKGASIDSFTAYYASKALKNHKWTADSKVSINIQYTDANNRTTTLNYKVVGYQEHWYGDDVVFGET